MRFLGVDLGSSFLKGAVLDLDALEVRHVERMGFPEPLPGLPPAFREFDPRQILGVVRTLLERLAAAAPDASGIVLCSQLHSLVLTDERGRPASNLISWQDQRALLPMPGGEGSYFDEINRRLTPDERRQLGNEPRPGVPLCFLFWLSENRALPRQPAVAATLPGLLVADLCGATPRVEVTSAFAHGALNLDTLDWHRPVIARLGLDRLGWPEIVGQAAILGEARIGSKTFPVFAPLGDYQCSQVGALLEEGELSVNISTGSAVLQLSSRPEFGDFQTRPFVDGQFVRTITHIPGGRALNALVRLLSELAEAQGAGLSDPWPYILAEAGRVTSTGLRVDPAFYFSATGRCGAITGACEENLSVGHLFRAAFEGMADNYARCARRITPAGDWRRVVFSGGLAFKIPLLRRLICERLGPEHRLAASEEDTLVGLLGLALAASGRAPSVRGAMDQLRKKRSQTTASMGSMTGRV